MASTAPYYQPTTSGSYQGNPITNYTTPADFETLAAQLTEEANLGEDDHLAGLLRAANAGQDPFAHIDAQPHAQPYTPAPKGRGKRKRGATSPEIQTDETAKRLKHDPPHASISAARAAGVHSAAALFRSPAPGSAKKYTRPPMSKLYASLNLTPEDFLHLQAAAKSYMLDSAHPERQDCVGNRAKGDNDMVKLKLFNCVRDFLADGIGERFFPETQAQGQDDATDGPGFGDEEDSPQQRWVWPKDGNQIVSLVTPLMRRMVTNERQRMYAHETRKGGKGDQVSAGPGKELLEMALQGDHLASPTPSADANGSRPQKRPLIAPTANSRKSQGAPSCSSNVIQFVFTHKDIKLLRFDWPDPDGTPRHAHMSFEKLIQTLCEHASGVRAAMSSASLSDTTSTFPFTPSPLAKLARVKATESIAKAKEQHIIEEAVDHDHDSPVAEAAGHSVDPGEQLRRELQSQAEDVAGENEEDQHPRDTSLETRLASLVDIGVHLRAFAPSGLKDISSEEQWDAVREEVGSSLWLEGCLRVAVEMR